MAIFYNQYDKDLSSWLSRIIAAGETPQKPIVSAVGNMVFSLKAQNLWDKLDEIYILSGLTNFNSIFQKLKYINTPALTNYSGNAFVSSNYISAGSQAGLVTDGASYKILNTGVVYNAYTPGNRTVGVYETRRGDASYATLIGRQRGGANSAFGPTVFPTTKYSNFRFLDTTVSSADGNSIVGPAGFFITSEINDLKIGRANQINYSSAFTPGTIGGTENYLLGGGIGGGGVSNSNISFGFIGKGLTATELTAMDTTVNTLMTSFSCNVY
jgi:hypothetical protein